MPSVKLLNRSSAFFICLFKSWSI